MGLPLATQLIQQTKAQIYAFALSVAEAVGVPVTSWATGDPTRSLYHLLSEVFAVAEGVAHDYVRSAFLDYATGDWLTLTAKQGFDVDRVEATFAGTAVTLTNNGGGLYDNIAAGDLTFRSSATGKTYHNTSGGTLASGPGTTLDVDVEADEPGSASSAGANEIDELVTTLLEVTVANAVAATGIDEESDPDLRARCRLKLSSISPLAPKGIYDYVARTPALSGATGITRSRTIGEGDTGDVTLYVAGPSGAVSAGDITAVTDAVNRLAASLCDTPTVSNTSNVVVAVTYTLWIYAAVGKTEAEITAAVEAALEAMFAARPIGGDIITPGGGGKLYKSLVDSTIRDALPALAFRVSVSAPAGDTALAISEVAALGTVTATINIVANP